ncbi:MAG: ATP-binding protein [Desulforhopalus sp.]|nr:ATP-binding protein [Desulforhopalus sp.]
MTRWLDFWNNRTIAARLQLNFLGFFLLIAMILVAWLVSLIRENRLETAIDHCREIENNVLDMDRKLEKAKLLHRNFFLYQARIGLNEAHIEYAQPSVRLISQAVGISSDLMAKIAQTGIKHSLKNRNIDLNLYLSSARRFADTSIQSIELLTRMVAPEYGLEHRFEKLAATLMQEAADAAKVKDRLHEIMAFYLQYKVSRQRHVMQSAFNVIYILNQQLQTAEFDSRADTGNVAAMLASLEQLGYEIVVTDNAIKGIFNDFSLQEQNVIPVAQALVESAHLEVRRVKGKISRSRQVTFLLIATLIGLALVWGFFIVRTINRSITMRILHLNGVAAQLRQGHLDIAGQDDSADELGQLSRTFNMMVGRIRELVGDLEAKIAERTRQLAESERWFRHLFENSPLGIFRTTTSGKVLMVNRDGAIMLGCESPAEVLAGYSNLAEQVYVDPSRRLAEIHELQTHGKIKHFECQWKKQNGENIWVSIHARLASDESAEGQNGYPIIDKFVLDITKRKETEDALQHYTFLMKEMGKAAKIGGWEFNPATGKGTWTEEVARIHELDPELPTNVELGISFYTDESKAMLIQAIHDANELKKPYVLELEMITAKGNHKWVRTIGYPFVENGRVVKISGSFQDITERKQVDTEKEALQLQLTQAQKMESVGRLAGGVAHDFNNMLGVIQGYTEIILEGTVENQAIHAALLEIQRATQRSVKLTKQLLAFARKQTVAPKVLNLNDTVESMLAMLRRLIGEDIELIWKPGKELGPVKIDPSQIDQILANLCVNARDAISTMGRITVETGNVDVDETYRDLDEGFQAGRYVLLAVSDNGCGMDEETRKRLFEPFFTTKDVGKGTGLGLASIYGIVKQNYGFIHVHSELGKGTAFRIYLPRHQDKKTPEYTADHVTPVSHGSETILLVEDEKAILTMTAIMLEQLGYQVLTANTAAEAMLHARNSAGKIQLLITDVIMPDMNGRTLAKTLLSTSPGLRILYISGHTADVITDHGVLDEGVFFLQKPFTRQGLASKIREALHRDGA